MSSQISFFFFFSFFILLVIVVSAKWARRLKLLAWNGVSAKSRIQQKLTYKFKKQKKKKEEEEEEEEKEKEKEKEKVTKKYSYQKSLWTNHGTLIFFVGEHQFAVRKQNSFQNWIVLKEKK